MLELLISQLQASTPPGDLDYDTMQMLLAPDGISGIQLGASVAISDDGRIIVLGALNSKTGSVVTGAAYVYEKTGDTYTWIQKLTASDGAESDYFGRSVAISGNGDTIIIGAYGVDTDNGANSGSAYVFKHIGSSYSQVQKLTASDGVSGDCFGYSVAISSDGSTIVTGSYRDDDKGSDSGSAYVFKYNGSNYTQVQKLTASDGVSDDFFGFSVAISSDGSTIVIGSHADDDKGTDSGSAYVFKYNGSNYTQVQKLTASDGATGDQFGRPVAISSDGSTIIISSVFKGDRSGSAYVFKYDGSGYNQMQKLTASDGASGDSFGWSVAISSDGSTIVTGSVFKGDRSGSVYVFKYDGQLYQEVKKLTGNKYLPNGYFGYSVAIASNTQQIAVGALRWTDETAVDTGAGFVFS